MGKGTLALQKMQRDGVTTIRVVVRGNVGTEGRAILDSLGLTPVIDMANCREKFVTTPEQLDDLRNALLAQGIVNK